METRSPSQIRTSLRWLLLNLVVGVVGAATAQLGNSLTVIPGYATAIWLPSGVNFAALLFFGWRVAPAVVLWNLLFHVATTLDPAHLGVWTAVNTSIAVAGLLQAALGAWLVRRAVDVGRGLAEVGDALRFLILAGPVSCLFSATVAVVVLWLGGQLAPPQVPFTWLTWWAGDCIGVVVVAPIALVLLAKPRHLWRPRVGPVGLPLLISFSLAILVFHRSRDWERSRLDSGFRADARVVNEALVSGLARYADALTVTKAHLLAVKTPTREAFQRFARVLIDRYPGLHALTWNVDVPLAGRAAFEAEARADGAPDFEVRELGADGRTLVRAGERPAYTVVRFVEPASRNRLAVGYDVASDPVRRAATEAARASGRPTASASVHLVQSPGTSHGMLVYLPLYRSEVEGRSGPGEASSTRVAAGATTVTTTSLAARAAIGGPAVGDRAGPAVGFVTAVLEIPEMLTAVLGTFPQDAVAITVQEGGADGPVLYRSTGDRHRPAPAKTGGESDGMRLVQTLHVPGVDGMGWLLTMTPTEPEVERFRSLQSWGVLLGGLAFTGMFGAFLLIVTGRTTYLEREVGERRRIEHDLQEAKVAAEAASEAKSAFLANMSHEIRTPLAAVLGFAELLAADGLAGTDRSRFKATIQRNGRHLTSLIDDILDLSSVEAGKLEIHRAPVSMHDLVDDVRNLLELGAGKKRLRLRFDVAAAVPPEVVTDAVRLRQILMNIVGNAVKFTESGGVDVRLDYAAPLLVIDVHDTGIGLSKSDATSLFEPFTQVDSSLRRRLGGTGLGLSLARRLARLLGGDVVLTESRPGEGSTFTVTVNAV